MAFAIIDCSHNITDWSNTEQWNTAISANLVEIVDGNLIKGSVPEPSDKEITNPNPKGADNMLIRYEYVFMADVNKISQANNTFMETIGGKTYYLTFVPLGAPDKLVVCEFDFMWSAKPFMVPDNTNEIMAYKMRAIANTDVNKHPVIVTKPADIFQ